MLTRRWIALAAVVCLLAFQVSPVLAEQVASINCIFYSNWNGGSDAKNTGDTGTGCVAGAEGSDVWTAMTGTRALITSGQFEGAGGLSVSATTGASYVTKTLASTYASCGIREHFQLATDGLTTSGDYIRICEANQSGGNTNICARINNDAGQLQVQGYYRNAANSLVTLGTPVNISAATGYQVELLFQQNTANGAYIKVWDSDGDTLMGSLQLSGATTHNSAIGLLVAGSSATASTGTSTLYIDVFEADSAGFVGPDTEQAPAAPTGSGSGVMW